MVKQPPNELEVPYPFIFSGIRASLACAKGGRITARRSGFVPSAEVAWALGSQLLLPGGRWRSGRGFERVNRCAFFILDAFEAMIVVVEEGQGT